MVSFTDRRPNARSAGLVIGLLLPVALAAGCGGTRYVPDINLSEVRPIVDATAEFHSLYPAPALVSGQRHFGLGTGRSEPVNVAKLMGQVEKEIFAELEKVGLFSRVTQYDPHPDFIVTGRIDEFYERYQPKIWTKIPGVGPIGNFLDLKTHESTGKVDLTLMLLKPDGAVVGQYRGRSSFDEAFNPTSEVPPGTRLNRALSDAVRQIQEQIVHDPKVRTIAAAKP
ncbi:MAG TPA: hypothetical protein VJ746_00100 [Nitrospira sp.]|nr:hypothetical protein [Nitrospira sp.]